MVVYYYYYCLNFQLEKKTELTNQLILGVEVGKEAKASRTGASGAVAAQTVKGEVIEVAVKASPFDA